MIYGYRIGPTTLVSDRAIENLVCVSTETTDGWSVNFESFQGQLLSNNGFVEVWKDCNDVLSVLQSMGCYMVRFHELADFIIDPTARSIQIQSPEDSMDETIDHLLLDQVLPRAMAHVDSMVLHAAGVLIDDQGIAFLGETGHGKSTLANSFMQAGYSLLTDDALVLNLEATRPTVQALYPCVRLWPESLDGLYSEVPQTAPMAHYSTKQRVMLDRSSRITTEPHLLGAAFVLKIGDTNQPVQFIRLGQQAACIELIKNSFQLAPNDPTASKRMFEQAVTLANTIPVFELIYPEGYEHLAETRACIQRQLKELDSSAGLNH